ncbi:hypothetical protein [Treponema primitia]|uniref:hypothetical protein n=1 Tax=Treponema primitia TaxID=88058 RepID=UPI0002555802|nr:hypothetical protein [Treponema primitia]
MPDKPAVENTDRLCSVYCPQCKKVTDKISFNLLREAGKVSVQCPVCENTTLLEYDGKQAAVWHRSQALDGVIAKVKEAKKPAK